MQPSYVFQQRAITPAKYQKQRVYCGQLDEQVGHKQAQLREASEREERMEKEERLQLAKECVFVTVILLNYCALHKCLHGLPMHT